MFVASVLTFGPAAAVDCMKDMGHFDDPWDIGSSAQVKIVQEMTQQGCTLFGFSWRFSKPMRREGLLLVDLERGEMLRLAIDPIFRPWEAWSGFTRDQVLADDSADGFNLSGYRPSRGREPAPVSPQFRSFMIDHRLEMFLP